MICGTKKRGERCVFFSFYYYMMVAGNSNFFFCSEIVNSIQKFTVDFGNNSHGYRLVVTLSPYGYFLGA